MTELKFYKAKSERIKSGIYISIILLILVFMLYRTYTTNDYMFVLIYLILSIPIIRNLISILRNKPTVRINNQGIRNNTNGMGLIPWSVIDHFEIAMVMKKRFLVVKLSDEETFLKNKNPISRTIMKTNRKKMGSSAVIGESEFNQSLEEVIVAINSYRSVNQL